MFEGDSWDFTAQAGRSRLAVGWVLMKERVMKEPSEWCSLEKPPAAHAGGGAEQRGRRPVITEQRAEPNQSGFPLHFRPDVNHSVKHRLCPFQVCRLFFA